MRVVIGLGANLGDRHATIAAAVERIAALPGVALVATSGLRETAPVGGPPDQPPYANGAALVETDLAPRALLAELLAIEASLGRVRLGEPRFGPRAIDLDLLLAGELVIDEDDLVVPHPRLLERTFALRPLLDVWPDARDPRDGRALAEALARLLCAERGLDTLGP